jgi:hypothetical protein
MLLLQRCGAAFNLVRVAPTQTIDRRLASSICWGHGLPVAMASSSSESESASDDASSRRLLSMTLAAAALLASAGSDVAASAPKSKQQKTGSMFSFFKKVDEKTRLSENSASLAKLTAANDGHRAARKLVDLDWAARLENDASYLAKAKRWVTQNIENDKYNAALHSKESLAMLQRELDTVVILGAEPELAVKKT